MSWLDDEWTASRAAVRQPDLDTLIAHGVTGAAMFAVGGIGVARIEAGRSTYEPELHGKPAVIVAALDRPARRPDGSAAWEALPLDLIAFHANAPTRWWTRCGNAVLLGEADLMAWSLGDEPAPIFADPLAWLRAAGHGFVVLDDDGLDALATLPAGIVADTLTHGNAIQRRYRARHQKLFRPPSILIRADRSAAT